MIYNSPIKINKGIVFIVFIIILIAFLAFFVKVNVTRLEKGVVDGVYRNACCSDIIIKEPEIIHGNEHFDIKISDMKFGLVGVVSGKFTPSRIQKSKVDTWIAFSKEDGKRVITLPVGNSFYSFESE
jgi:hypothetical protein